MAKRLTLPFPRYSLPAQDTVSMADVAHVFNVADLTVLRWRKRGMLPEPLPSETGRVRWPRKVIEDLIENLRNQPA